MSGDKECENKINRSCAGTNAEYKEGIERFCSSRRISAAGNNMGDIYHFKMNLLEHGGHSVT